MKNFLLIFALLFISHVVVGQKDTAKREKIYKLNYWVDVPVTAGLFVGYYYGLKAIEDKPAPTAEEINALNKEDVWFFDRRALYQSTDQMDNARNVSDWGLRIAGFMPVLLFIDKKIRKDWYDITLLYLETQAVAQNLYLLGGPLFIDRLRPYAYYDELSMDERTGTGVKNSWFSGHTSTTAAASFFMAKVISDYHPELGGKKWLVYGAALIPTFIVGFHRIRALKHFPTDVIIGTGIGAAAGILIPHFHKLTRKNKDLSIVPFAGQYSGLAMSLKF